MYKIGINIYKIRFNMNEATTQTITIKRRVIIAHNGRKGKVTDTK